MKIKELREKMNWSQGDLAKLLSRTQQTVSRWESGATEPGIEALRDMAMIFGCSVDDILGLEGISPSNKLTVSIPHADALAEEFDGCWGNLGLKMRDREHIKWYPISASQREEIKDALNGEILQTQVRWFTVTTLNNRALVVNPKAMRRIWLLAEEHDEPENGDFVDIGDAITGWPLELYRGLSEWASCDDEKAWHKGTSKKYRSAIAAFVSEKNLDQESALDLVHSAHIFDIDGNETSYWVDEQNAYDAINAIDAGEGEPPAAFELSHQFGEFESFFPAANIALIDLPLLDIIDVHKSMLEEYESEARQQENR